MSKIVPYKGSKPYIFISYAHRDKEQVYPVLAQMQADGYRVWFDEGIDPGTEWDEVIAAHVEECGYFLAFISENYLASENCKDELNYARDLEKKRLLVYLEDVKLRGGMAMRMNRLQSIFKHKYTNPADFFAMLYSADGIEDFFSAADKVASVGEPSAPKAVPAAKPAPKPAPKPKAPPAPRATTPPSQASRGLSFTAHGQKLSVAGIGSCTDKAIVIPATHDGKPVVRFETDALKGSAITSLIIPEGVEELGVAAFRDCASLAQVKLPSSLRRLNGSSFRGCSALTSIALPDAIIEISSLAFDGCSSLSSVTLPSRLSSIGKWAFDGCRLLTSIEIPGTLTTLEDKAFTNCTSLTEIRFGGTVAAWRAVSKAENWRLGSPAITVRCTDGTVTESDNTAPAETNGANISFRAAGASRGLAFSTSSDKSVVTGIGSFTGSTVDIPATHGGKPVKEIGTEAFKDCTAITTVVLPMGLEEISVAAFRGCSKLTSVTIPPTVTRIWSSAFRGCSALGLIFLPDGLSSVDNMMFDGCVSLTSVHLPQRAARIGKWAFDSCRSLRSITIPRSVTKIEDKAFVNCTSLAEMIFEGTVDEWRAVSKGEQWRSGVPSPLTVKCKNGSYTEY